MIFDTTAEAQVRFLTNIQKILDGGGFVATYKYALLQALSDLSLLKGGDSGSELELKTQEIADKFIEFYWRQALPYRLHGVHELVTLKQNSGRQAGVINDLKKAQAKHETLAKLKNEQSEWKKVLRSVDGTVRDQPLWRLQTIGSEKYDFLYENVGEGSSITLKPGVAFCFRKFYGLISSLIRGAWLSHVRKLNVDELGTTQELGAFLFGASRQNLGQLREVLTDVQEGSCFYCSKRLKAGSEVDHFIPWSRFPNDLGHNFVLAHGNCNKNRGVVG